MNDEGKILLVRSFRRGWELPGGIVEHGENLMDGVKREIFEESGICAEVGEVFCISSNTNSYPGYNGVKVVPPKVIFDFVCRAVGGELTASEETAECGWFSAEEALEMIEHPVMRARFEAFTEHAGRPVYMEYVTRREFVLKLKRHI